MYKVCVCKELNFGSLDDIVLLPGENDQVCNHTATYLSTLKLNKMYSDRHSSIINHRLIDALSRKVVKITKNII